MATQGPNVTGTAISGATAGTNGTNVWANPTNAQSEDGVFTTSTTSAAVVATKYLECSNFGFSIPAGATIVGLEIGVKVKSSGTTQYHYRSSALTAPGGIFVIKGGTRVGTTQVPDSTTTVTTTLTWYTFGGPTNLWGTTLTVSDVNASNFGAAVAYPPNNTGKQFFTISVDAVRITVYYTPAAGGNVQRQTIMRQAVNRAGTY